MISNASDTLLGVWVLMIGMGAIQCFTLAIVIRIWRMEMRRRPCEEQDIEIFGPSTLSNDGADVFTKTAPRELLGSRDHSKKGR